MHERLIVLFLVVGILFSEMVGSMDTGGFVFDDNWGLLEYIIDS